MAQECSLQDLVKTEADIRMQAIGRALDYLDSIGLDYTITGSLSLKLYGVIDRAPGDLDIVVHTDPTEIIRSLEIPDSESTSRDGTDARDTAVGTEYWHRRVGGADVCIFKRLVFVKTKIEFMGKKREVAHPGYSIDAKLQMLKNKVFLKDFKFRKAVQHAEDVLAYYRWRGADNGTLPNQV